MRGLVLPTESADEAAIVEGLEIIPVSTLSEARDFIEDGSCAEPRQVDANRTFSEASTYTVDWSEVKGQESAKRALEITAAGGHNVLMMSLQIPMPPLMREPRGMRSRRPVNTRRAARENRASNNCFDLRGSVHGASHALLRAMLEQLEVVVNGKR
jgi:hypothetical protein